MRSEAHTDYNYNNFKFSADVTLLSIAVQKNAQHAEDASGITKKKRVSKQAANNMMEEEEEKIAFVAPLFLLSLSPCVFLCAAFNLVFDYHYFSLLHNDATIPPKIHSFIQISVFHYYFFKSCFFCAQKN